MGTRFTSSVSYDPPGHQTTSTSSSNTMCPVGLTLTRLTSWQMYPVISRVSPSLPSSIVHTLYFMSHALIIGHFAGLYFRSRASIVSFIGVVDSAGIQSHFEFIRSSSTSRDVSSYHSVRGLLVEVNRPIHIFMKPMRHYSPFKEHRVQRLLCIM